MDRQYTLTIFFKNGEVLKWRNVTNIEFARRWLNNPTPPRNFRPWRYFNVYGKFDRMYYGRIYPDSIAGMRM